VTVERNLARLSSLSDPARAAIGFANGRRLVAA
jgi:hypothetical protein